jgi:hypothetical protein
MEEYMDWGGSILAKSLTRLGEVPYQPQFIATNENTKK